MSPWIGPGPDDGDLHHQVVERRGLSLGSMLICARLSIWKVPSVSALRIMA